MLNRLTARWLVPALLSIAALLCFSTPADAAWKLENVKWRMNGRQAIGFGAPDGRGTDTTYVSAAPARADTTTEWSMIDAEPYAFGNGIPTTADSVFAGHVIVAGDSAVASTVDFTGTTVTLQVNYGDRAGGWQNFASAISPLPTAGTKSVFIPLLARNVSITADIGPDYLSPGQIFAPRLRAIVTWGTSAAVPSARVRVRKWIGIGTAETKEKAGDIER